MNEKITLFLIGEREGISEAEAKRIMLLAYMAICSFFISLAFLLISFISRIYYWVPANATVGMVSMFCIFLIKVNKFKTAKVVLTVILNIVIFWSAFIDPFDDGTYLLFIPLGIGAFALMDYKDLNLAIGLAAMSTILFLLSYLDVWKNYELPPHSPEYHQYAFLLIYLLSFALSIGNVHFLVNLNHLAEAELIQKKDLALQKNVQLQRVNERLDRLVYSVSHDLRSPLNSILGLTSLLEYTRDEEECKKLIRMIRESIKVQNNHIHEIIERSRNFNNQIQVEEVDLEKLVDEIINSLRYSAEAVKIQFIKIIPEKLKLLTDRICLWMAMSNLVGNAIKYHNLKRANPFIKVGYNIEDQSIYVTDNGIGIKPEHSKNIFNMYYRGSDKIGGNGLGLYLIKESIEKVGWKIEMTSVYGEGSTFKIRLDQSSILADRPILQDKEASRVDPFKDEPFYYSA